MSDAQLIAAGFAVGLVFGAWLALHVRAFCRRLAENRRAEAERRARQFTIHADGRPWGK